MDFHIARLLLLLQEEKDLGILVRLGYDYRQIAILSQHAIEAGYLEFTDDGGFIVSGAGSELVQRFHRLISASPRDWIRPLDDFRVEKVDPEKVYLPENDIFHRARPAD